MAHHYDTCCIYSMDIDTWGSLAASLLEFWTPNGCADLLSCRYALLALSPHADYSPTAAAGRQGSPWRNNESPDARLEMTRDHGASCRAYERRPNFSFNSVATTILSVSAEVGSKRVIDFRDSMSLLVISVWQQKGG